MNDKITCNFCGEPVTNGMISKESTEFAICDRCISEGVTMLMETMKADGLTPLQMFDKFQELKYSDRTVENKTEDTEIKEDVVREVLKPHEIKSKLDDYVIDQDDAKKVLAVASYNHYKRIGALKKISGDVDIEKSNILLLGPTGTGKTLLVKTLAKVLDVPFAIADATGLTENGYVGDDVETVVEKLYLAAGKNPKKAERGIIYIDEIDKLAADFESSRKDVGGAGVQQSLLKIIEGSKIHFVATEDKKNPMAKSITIDTSNILFIVGGAFASIDYEGVNNEALKDYGLIPELIGRLPVVTMTKELSEDAMLRILTEPKNSLIKQYQALFSIEDIALQFTDSALKSIAKQGIDKGTGARGLRGVVEKIMLDLAYDAPSMDGVTDAVVDAKNNQIVRRFFVKKQEVA